MNLSAREITFGTDYEDALDILIVELFYQAGIRLKQGLIELKEEHTSLQKVLKVIGKKKKERSMSGLRDP